MDSRQARKQIAQAINRLPSRPGIERIIVGEVTEEDGLGSCQHLPEAECPEEHSKPDE